MWKIILQGAPARVVRGQIVHPCITSVHVAPSTHGEDDEKKPQNSLALYKPISSSCDHSGSGTDDHDSHYENAFRRNMCWWKQLGLGDHVMEAVGLGAVLLFGSKLSEYYKICNKSKAGDKHSLLQLPSLSTVSHMNSDQHGTLQTFNIGSWAKAWDLCTKAAGSRSSATSSHPGVGSTSLKISAGRDTDKSKKSETSRSEWSIASSSKDKSYGGSSVFTKSSSSLQSDSNFFETHEVAEPEAVYEFRTELDQLYKLHEASVNNHRAVKAAKQEQYGEAFKHWQVAAKQGSEKALFNLGLCYENGQGVSKDIVKAKSFYRQAANKGSGSAAHNLALLLMDSGESTGSVSPLLQQACDAGVGAAHSLLGVLYIEQGRVEEAARLFQKAADLQDADGCYFLATCLDHGIGIDQHDEQALHMYAVAARSGHTKALAAFHSKVLKLETRIYSRDPVVRTSRSSPDLSPTEASNVQPTLTHSSSCIKSFAPSYSQVISSSSSSESVTFASDKPGVFVEYQEKQQVKKRQARQVKFYLSTQDQFTSDGSDWDADSSYDSSSGETLLSRVIKI